MTKQHFKYSHLRRIGLWLGLIFIPLTLVTGLHQYDLLTSPFDLNRLSKNQVLLFEHRSGRQLYAVKLETLKNRSRPDILITGNHVMRNFQGSDHFGTTDLFNFALGNPSIFEELDLLKALGKIDRLPKKFLIYTLLAHGGKERLVSREQKVFSGGNVEPPFSIGYPNLASESNWLFKYETVLDALFSLTKTEIVIDYPDCQKAHGEAGKAGPNFWLDIRLKLSEYLPTHVAVNSGLLDSREFCLNDRNYNSVNGQGLARDGGIMARGTFEMTYHRVYDYPVLSPSEARASAREAVIGIRRLEKFADENDFRIVYLVPPRYEIPLDGPNDEVVNLIFENNPDLTVIDLRRVSEQTGFYVDGTHISENFGEILAPCLEKISNSKTPLPSRPAVGSRGRTVC